MSDISYITRILQSLYSIKLKVIAVLFLSGFDLKKINIEIDLQCSRFLMVILLSNINGNIKY